MNSPLQASIAIYHDRKQLGRISPRIFGNFLEHLGYAVNRHREEWLQLDIDLRGGGAGSQPEWIYLADPDITARTRLGDAERFALQQGHLTRSGNRIQANLPLLFGELDQPVNTCRIANYF
jgi:hypothetical protein